MREGTVSAGLARGLVDYAARRGADLQALADRSGIPGPQLDDLNARIPLRKYRTLIQAAKEACGDPAIALHYGSDVDLSTISVVGLLFNSAESVLEGLRQVNRYGSLAVEVALPGQGRARFERRNDQLWAVDMRRDSHPFPELTETTFARFIGMTTRSPHGSGVLEVHVTHSAPDYLAEYDRAFRAPTVFDSEWNAMRIDESWLTRRIPTQPGYVFGIFAEHAENLLKRLESSKTTRGEVESVLLPRLHSGDANVQAAAVELGMSRQTLYRRLKGEGTTFENVLDELRHELALHYLTAERVSVNEIAYLLGFSTAAAFSRAFKRWTGKSPRHASIGPR